MVICTLILTQISSARRNSEQINRQIEGLNVAKMAMDIGRDNLSENGVSIKIKQTNKNFIIFDDKGKEQLALKILDVQK